MVLTLFNLSLSLSYTHALSLEVLSYTHSLSGYSLLSLGVVENGAGWVHSGATLGVKDAARVAVLIWGVAIMGIDAEMLLSMYQVAMSP